MADYITHERVNDLPLGLNKLLNRFYFVSSGVTGHPKPTYSPPFFLIMCDSFGDSNVGILEAS